MKVAHEEQSTNIQSLEAVHHFASFSATLYGGLRTHRRKCDNYENGLYGICIKKKKKGDHFPRSKTDFQLSHFKNKLTLAIGNYGAIIM